MAGSLLSALSLLFAPKHAILDPAFAGNRVNDAFFAQISGEPLALSGLAGKTVLVVNTASRCGFKSQFADLQSLYDDLRREGLVILAVPSNDFGNQEPCDDRTVYEAYRSQLDVSFPVTAKVSIKGQAMHPFFRQIQAVAGENAVPRWNFYKYLIAPNGNLAGWFSTPITTNAAIVRGLIETCLQMQPHATRVSDTV